MPILDFLASKSAHAKIIRFIEEEKIKWERMQFLENLWLYSIRNIWDRMFWTQMYQMNIDKYCKIMTFKRMFYFMFFYNQDFKNLYSWFMKTYLPRRMCRQAHICLVFSVVPDFVCQKAKYILTHQYKNWKSNILVQRTGRITTSKAVKSYHPKPKL